MFEVYIIIRVRVQIISEGSTKKYQDKNWRYAEPSAVIFVGR